LKKKYISMQKTVPNAVKRGTVLIFVN